MKRYRYAIQCALLAVLGINVLVGCQRNEDNKARNNYKVGASVNDRGGRGFVGPNLAGRAYTDDKTEIANKEVKRGELNTRAQKIADALDRIEGVQRANVLIIGDGTALVGVQLNKGITGDAVRAIKARVQQIAKDSDDFIDRVTVTTSPSLVTRIGILSNRVRKGESFDAFRQELRDILRKASDELYSI